MAYWIWPQIHTMAVILQSFVIVTVQVQITKERKVSKPSLQAEIKSVNFTTNHNDCITRERFTLCPKNYLWLETSPVGMLLFQLWIASLFFITFRQCFLCEILFYHEPQTTWQNKPNPRKKQKNETKQTNNTKQNKKQKQIKQKQNQQKRKNTK